MKIKISIAGVFHVAGYGFGGTTNLPAFNAQTKKVNVDGTQNVINACINHNVRALGKYPSTYLAK